MPTPRANIASMTHSLVLLSVSALEPFLDTVAHAQLWDERTKFHIQLALEELVVNAFSHGQSDQKIRVAISIRRVDQHIEIDLDDNGMAFDPTTLPAPDTQSSEQAREVGGLGVYFAKKMMDEFVYRREGPLNCVRLKKVVNS
jgi:serine/threonine-protein kinase RsbW